MLEALTQSGSARRWTFYVLLIWAGAELSAIIFLVPETYHPAYVGYPSAFRSPVFLSSFFFFFLFGPGGILG